MYCQKCGKEVNDEAVVCIHCGCAIKNTQVQNGTEDAPDMAMSILGFFIPILGLILYLVWKSTYPKKAQSAGKGALIGFCVSIFFYVIAFAITASAF